MEQIKKQQKTITLLLALGGIATATIGVVAFISNIKFKKMQEELFAIDKEIKLLQLANLKEKRA